MNAHHNGCGCPDPHVSVFYDRECAPGASSLAEFESDPGRFLADESMPLSEVLSTCWDHDAHLAQYVLLDEERARAHARVNKRGSSFVSDLVAAGGAVVCPILVFDHDRHAASGDKLEWTREGLCEFVQFLAESEPNLLPTHWYTTKHGSRFVYVLTEPLGARDAEGLMLGLMRDWAQRGLELDPSCKDWTRLFRLPRVLRGVNRTEQADYFEHYEFGQLLDPSIITPGDPGQVNGAVAVASYQGDQPDADTCNELLYDVSPKSGREVMSTWVQVARQWLKGREAFDVCFKHAPIDVSEGWNNGVTKLVGSMVGMLARQEEASPEGIYALLYASLEQLQEEDETGDTDWLDVGWSLVCRMWDNESAQIAAEQAEREAHLADAHETRDDLIKVFRERLPGSVPDEPEGAQSWLRERMIASTGSKHHIMMRDGTYTVSAFSDSMLIPAIRDLGMDDVIEIHEMRGKVWAEKSPRSILNGQAIPVSRVVCSSAADVASVEGEPGYRTLTIPIHQLDPHLSPQFSEEVDSWLRSFLGPAYERGVEWLSHSLDVRRAICALNLHGASGAGKDMLVQGLAECFRHKSKTDGNKVFSRFNDSLLESPIVHFDEGVPTGNLPGCNTTDQTFRTLVSGGMVSIEGKGEKVISAHVYPRIVFTSNDQDVMRAIVGQRDLSDDDVEAIEVRLLSIRVASAAKRYLSDRGNYRHTAGWVKGEQPSRFVIARHILWLYENRQEPRGSGRLLVEGDVGGVRQSLRRSRELSLLLSALYSFLEGRGGIASAGHLAKGLESRNDAVLCASTGSVASQSTIGIGTRTASELPATGPGLYLTTAALQALVKATSEYKDHSRSLNLSDLKEVGRKAGVIDDLGGKTIRLPGVRTPKRYQRIKLARLAAYWLEDGMDFPRTEGLLDSLEGDAS